MFTFEESIIKSATSPVSFQAAYNNKHSAFDHFYNNLPISRAQNQVPSYTNYKFSSNNNNVVGSSSFPSIRGGGGGVSSTSMNTTEVMAFHSSTKWRTYFEASKQSNKLVVMFFTATWCRPCRSMEPIIKELGAKYPNVDLVKIDVDELFNVSREFKVQTMPTFVFMKNGKEIDRVSGAKKEDLQRKVENHGA